MLSKECNMGTECGNSMPTVQPATQKHNCTTENSQQHTSNHPKMFVVQNRGMCGMAPKHSPVQFQKKPKENVSTVAMPNVLTLQGTAASRPWGHKPPKTKWDPWPDFCCVRQTKNL